MRSLSFILICTAAVVAGAFISLRPAHASVVIDPSVSQTNTSHNGTTFTDVFTSDQVGYAFYRDSNGTCVYAKTTDGGTTWGGAVTVDSQTDCLRVAVWYDRWTPGNTTGTVIHVATIDSGSDDLWYTRLDTASDTLSTTLDISGANQGGRFVAGGNLQAITEATDGTLYSGVESTQDSFVLKCASGCTTTINNWIEAGTSTTWGTLANNWLMLSPLPGGDVIATNWVIASNLVQSKVWHAASTSWDASWTTVDSNCPDNTTYDGHFGSTVNPNTKDIYLAYACNVATLGTDDAIRTATYDSASSTWTRDADVETTSTLGITGAKIGLDVNTGNVYVVYSGRTTPATANTANVYYKISTSTSMSSWGARQGPINTTSTDIYGLRIDGQNNRRLYATWVDGAATTRYLNGVTVAQLFPTTYTEAAYRFFGNTDGTQVGNPLGATNASSALPVAGTPFRLRMLIAVGGGGADIDRDSFKLQFATSTGGGCDAGFAGETYVDVATSTGVIRYYNNPTPANGAALTANAQDPIDGTNVIVNQTYQEQNPFSNDIAKIFGGQDGKWDFSIQNASGTQGQTFCFRMVKADGSLLDSYTNVAEGQVDTPPTMSGLSLNGGQSVTLVEGTTTLIVATATVSDANGYGDLYSVNGVMYRTSLGSGCTANNNNCYVATPADCTLDNCSGNSCRATCNYSVWYFAEPTDVGTPWSGDSWSTYMNVTDANNASATATSSGVSLLSLLALRTGSSINYGSFTAGQSMSNLTATTTIRPTGNVSMNVAVYGTDMVLGTSTIPLGQQHFATSSATYASGTTLLANPGSTLPLGLPKVTSTVGGATTTFYWGIAIPSTQRTGNYTGYNAFVGVINSLPWP